MAKQPRNPGGGDYEIGYGKPPKHSQFQPGQSGNRVGRANGSRGLKTDLQRELAASHTIHINGREVKGPRQLLMVRTLTTRAATGDLKAIALLIPLVLQIFGIEDRGTGKAQLSAQDQGRSRLHAGPAQRRCVTGWRDGGGGRLGECITPRSVINPNEKLCGWA